MKFNLTCSTLASRNICDWSRYEQPEFAEENLYLQRSSIQYFTCEHMVKCNMLRSVVQRLCWTCVDPTAFIGGVIGPHGLQFLALFIMVLQFLAVKMTNL